MPPAEPPTARGRPTDVAVECADGYRLHARVFPPADPAAARGITVVVAPATGAKASYYWRYAAFLSDAGFRAVVADYRGIGRSGPAGGGPALRSLPVRWHEWGTLDLDAVLGWARDTAPGDRITVVGHSFGGFATCLAPRATTVSRLLLVGAQHAHWADYRRGRRLVMVWRWHLVMPALTAVLGRFPGRRLGWTEDLPAGVAFDWARGRADFGRTVGGADPGALRRAAALDLDVLAVAAGDDPFATPRATARTLGYLTSARVDHWLIEPEDHGLDVIGHLGLFHDRLRPVFWPRSADWLGAEP
ncbi:alpha/beta fold hydrolase, partial [Streptomyces lonarensis]